MKQFGKLAVIIAALVFTLESPRLFMLEPKVYTAEETEEKIETIQVSSPKALPSQIRLDVPLENQFEEEALGNGCEVTALSMLLQYYEIDTNKNKLADSLDYVPLITESGKYGNPHEGFVGNIYEGKETMGVAVEPIAKLAQRSVGNRFKVSAGSNGDFAEIMSIVAAGTPVWIVTTLDFEVPTEEDFHSWEMDDGTTTVSPLIHAAVITGFEQQDLVYVNDPSGTKDRPVSWDQMGEIFNKMGGQFVYLSNIRQA